MNPLDISPDGCSIETLEASIIVPILGVTIDTLELISEWILGDLTRCVANHVDVTDILIFFLPSHMFPNYLMSLA